jgi:DNA-binding GntR family transcriptional regulator
MSTFQRAPQPSLSSAVEALSRSIEAKPAIADQIAEMIRRLILSGELRPGERVVESRIAKQLGVGQPTVREALVALEHEGLISRKTNQGCHVTAFTRDEIEDILRIREQLEALAVEQAIDRASDDDLRQLELLAHEMARVAKENDAQSFHSCDQLFHETLWRASGNPFLARLLSQTMLPLLAFLFIRSVRVAGSLDLVHSADAHVEIAQCLLNRDRARARAVIDDKFRLFARQHLERYEG